MRRMVSLQAALLVLLVLAALVTALPTRADEAGPAVLTRDLNVTIGSAEPSVLTTVGDLLFFRANDGVHGHELWVSNGTAAGSRMVKDLTPGDASSKIGAPVVIGGLIFFTTEGKLWRSDGTEAGTILLAQGTIFGLDALGSRLIFAIGVFAIGGQTVTDDDGLWITDGTPSGTRRIIDKGLVDTPVVIGNVVYYSFRYDASNYGVGRTDGTPDGTVLLFTSYVGGCRAAGHADLKIGGCPEPTWPPDDLLLGFKGELYFQYGRHSGLYRYGNEQSLLPASPQRRVWQALAVGDRFFFVALVNGLPPELWVSDGTQNGTRRVRIMDGFNNRISWSLTALDDRLMFVPTNEQDQTELWVSDGTEAGTLPLTALASAPQGSAPAGLTVLDDRLFFAANTAADHRELWVSDGTAAGTRPWTSLGERGRVATTSIAQLGGRRFFTACDAAGCELWASDGTPTGTARVADINPITENSRLIDMAGIGKYGFFFTDQQQLWVSDGTAQGTRQIQPAPDDPFEDLRLATPVGDRLFFFNEPGYNLQYFYLHIADPQSSRTEIVPITYWIDDAMALGERLIFSTYYELWASDGTPAGTDRIKVFKSSDAFGICPTLSKPLGGKVYFTTCPDERGEEEALWASDGTAEGTQLITVLSGTTDYLSKGPTNFALVGDTLFFTLRSGPGQLWASDGTAAGTRMVLTVDPFAAPGAAQFSSLVAAGDRLLFIANEPNVGSQIWSSDGTAQGTRMVKDSAPDYGPDGSWPPQLVAAGGRAYFVADTPAHGRELWASDGTLAGTRQVFESAPGDDARRIYGLMAFSDLLLFGTHGADGDWLWRSDGTAAGTQKVQELRLPYDPSSPPALSVQTGDRLFFMAGDQRSGVEPWMLALQDGVATRLDAPAQLSATPGGTVDLPLRFLSDGTALARDARLTLTLGGGVSYVSDTSGGTSQRSGNTVSWKMPNSGPLAGGTFNVRLRLPAAPGTRLPLTLTLSTPGERTPADNTRTVTLLLGHQLFLPAVRR